MPFSAKYRPEDCRASYQDYSKADGGEEDDCRAGWKRDLDQAFPIAAAFACHFSLPRSGTGAGQRPADHPSHRDRRQVALRDQRLVAENRTAAENAASLWTRHGAYTSHALHS